MADIKFVKSDPNLKVPVIQEKNWNVFHILYFVVASLFLLYFFGIVVYSGFSYFQLIWLIAAICFFFLGILSVRRTEKKQRAKWINILLYGLSTLVLGVFLFVEGLILSGFVNKDFHNLDYIVVLGARVKDHGPSLILRQRLDCAIDYLVQNPGTQVIVSGGQGTDEPTTEALGMKNYLIQQGNIEESRIIMEENSFSTFENLSFSKEFIEEGSTIGIITSNFHSFRAMRIAEELNYDNVVSIPASSDLFLLPTNLLRESMAVIKDVFVGNLSFIP